jgi:hypothetical protein
MPCELLDKLASGAMIMRVNRIDITRREIAILKREIAFLEKVLARPKDHQAAM